MNLSQWILSGLLFVGGPDLARADGEFLWIDSFGGVQRVRELDCVELKLAHPDVSECRKPIPCVGANLREALDRSVTLLPDLASTEWERREREIEWLRRLRATCEGRVVRKRRHIALDAEGVPLWEWWERIE